MKDFARAPRPNSLFGQLVLVMLLSAAILQTVNFYSVYSIQRAYSGDILGLGRDYIASTYQALQEMDGAQRARFLEKVSASRPVIGKPFRFRIFAEGPDWETEDYYKALDTRDLDTRDVVKRALAAAGVEPPDVRARVLDGNSPQAGDPAYRSYLFPLLQVMLPLGDGAWLEVTQPLSITDRRPIWRQRIFILLESLVFSVIVILLIRRATRPLHKLGLAAESFGRNPEIVQPLEETGAIEVREAAQSFNKMRRRICDNMKERNNMLEAMGHDLRTPLARLQLRLDKIQPDALREKIAANIDEVQSIVEQGLELARSLQTSEREARLDVAAFVESIVDDMQAQGENVALAGAPGQKALPLLVTAHPTCLKRGVENLLSNAIHYAGGARVAVAEENGCVVIDIDDDGPGIPEDLLEKVFEPYYRLEYSRNRESGGTGLGLAIARNMVLLDNGSIRLSNRPEGGLRARVVLPKDSGRPAKPT